MADFDETVVEHWDYSECELCEDHEAKTVPTSQTACEVPSLSDVLTLLDCTLSSSGSSDTDHGEFEGGNRASTREVCAYQVVLKGGGPWGFTLSGGAEVRLPLQVAEIEPEGKAGTEGSLQIGDYVISVNDVECRSITEAVQLIQSAFRTLTLLLWRGNASNVRGPSYVRQAQHSLEREQEPVQSQDDSIMYAESKHSLQPGEMKMKARQKATRGESFCIGNSSANSGKSTLGTGYLPLPSRANELTGRNYENLRPPRSSAADNSARPPQSQRVQPFSRPLYKRLSQEDLLERSRRFSGSANALPNAIGAKSGPLSPAKSTPALSKSTMEDVQSPRSYYASQPTFYATKSSPNIIQELDVSILGEPPKLKRPSVYSDQHLNKFDTGYAWEKDRNQYRSGNDRNDYKFGQSSVQQNLPSPRDNYHSNLHSPRGDHPNLSSHRGDYSNLSSPRGDQHNLPSTRGDHPGLPSSVRHSPQNTYHPDTSFQPIAREERYGRRSLPHKPNHKRHDYQNIGDVDSYSKLSAGYEPSSDSSDSELEEPPAIPPPPRPESLMNSGYIPPLSPPAAAPVRDIASLKYIKVNQSHEKFPSWPVTAPSSKTITDPSQPITTRAESWSDHTNTSSEFPKKQRMAYEPYQPKLRPLTEKNSPLAERKTEDGKSRNASDPGLKSDLLYHASVAKIEDSGERMKNFYNSQPGYPPPKYDSDGHNLGDKEYSVPSPPERDIPVINTKLPPSNLASTTPQQYDVQMDSSRSVSKKTVTDSSTSPLDNNEGQFSDSVLNGGSASSSGRLTRSEQSEDLRDSEQYKSKHVDSRGYIVTPKPYYNTSTQTDRTDSLDRSATKKDSDKKVSTRHVEVQVSDMASQTSPKRPDSIDEPNWKDVDEKSIQARLSWRSSESDSGGFERYSGIESRPKERMKRDRDQEQERIRPESKGGQPRPFSDSNDKVGDFDNKNSQYNSRERKDRQSNRERDKESGYRDRGKESGYRDRDKDSADKEQKRDRHYKDREKEQKIKVGNEFKDTRDADDHRRTGSVEELEDRSNDFRVRTRDNNNRSIDQSSVDNTRDKEYSRREMGNFDERGEERRPSSRGSKGRRSEPPMPYSMHVDQENTTDTVQNVQVKCGENSSHPSIPSFHEYTSSTAPMLRMLSKEMYRQQMTTGRPQYPHHDKCSSQETSSRCLASPTPSSQYGNLKEAESYSSVLIYSDVSSGPFGRDDFGSQQSLGSQFSLLQEGQPIDYNKDGSMDKSSSFDVSKNADDHLSPKQLRRAMRQSFDNSFLQQRPHGLRPFHKYSGSEASLSCGHSHNYVNTGELDAGNKSNSVIHQRQTSAPSQRSDHRNSSSSSIEASPSSSHKTERPSSSSADLRQNMSVSSKHSSSSNLQQPNTSLLQSDSRPNRREKPLSSWSSGDLRSGASVRHKKYSSSGSSSDQTILSPQAKQERLLQDEIPSSISRRPASAGSRDGSGSTSSVTVGSKNELRPSADSKLELRDSVFGDEKQELPSSFSQSHSSTGNHTDSSGSVNSVTAQRRSEMWSQAESKRETKDSVFSDDKPPNPETESPLDTISTLPPRKPASEKTVTRQESMKRAVGTFDEVERTLYTSTHLNKTSKSWNNLQDAKEKAKAAQPPPRSQSYSSMSSYQGAHAGRNLAETKRLEQIKEANEVADAKLEAMAKARSLPRETSTNYYGNETAVDKRKNQPKSYNPKMWEDDSSIRKGASVKLSNLKRTTSEQIRPIKSRDQAQQRCDELVEKKLPAVDQETNLDPRLNHLSSVSERRVSTDNPQKWVGSDLKKSHQALLNFVERKKVRSSGSISSDSTGTDSMPSPTAHHRWPSSSSSETQVKMYRSESFSESVISGGSDSRRHSTSSVQSQKDERLSRLPDTGVANLRKDPLLKSSALPAQSFAQEEHVTRAVRQEASTSALMPRPYKRPPPPVPNGNEKESDSPPALPPRNYRKFDDQDLPPLNATSNGLRRYSTEGRLDETPAKKQPSMESLKQERFDSPQEDTYRDQLRQQARRLSEHMMSNPARINFEHSKLSTFTTHSFPREPMIPQEATPIAGGPNANPSTVVVASPALTPTRQQTAPPGSSEDSSSKEDERPLTPLKIVEEGRDRLSASCDVESSPELPLPSPPKHADEEVMCVEGFPSPPPEVLTGVSRRDEHEEDDDDGENDRYAEGSYGSHKFNRPGSRKMGVYGGSKSDASFSGAQVVNSLGRPKKLVDRQWRSIQSLPPSRLSPSPSPASPVTTPSDSSPGDKWLHSYRKPAEESSPEKSLSRIQPERRASENLNPSSASPLFNKSYSCMSARATPSSRDSLVKSSGEKGDKPSPSVRDRVSNFERASPTDQQFFSAIAPNNNNSVNVNPTSGVQLSPSDKSSPLRNTVKGLRNSFDNLANSIDNTPTDSSPQQKLPAKDSSIKSRTSKRSHPPLSTSSQRQSRENCVSVSKSNNSASSVIKSNSVANTTTVNRTTSPSNVANVSAQHSSIDERVTNKGDNLVVIHRREKSREEEECDRHAKILVHQLKESDSNLCKVISPPFEKKIAMDYMNGLFEFTSTLELPVRKSSNTDRPHVSPQSVGNTDSSKSSPSDKKSESPLPADSPYWYSSAKAKLIERMRENGNEDGTTEQDGDNIEQKKEELMERIKQKLMVLQKLKDDVQEDVDANNALGNHICQCVEEKCRGQNEKDKYKSYIEDLEKIVRLLLKLSGLLARAENALNCLSQDDEQQQRTALVDKRDRLVAQHEEAKRLKADIDKRRDVVGTMLKNYLSADEIKDYMHFVDMKSLLTIELQEHEDKITLGQEQLQALKRSIEDN